MRLPWKRRREQPAVAPRPNYTTIAVLEHDLFGIQPQPGTAAALAIGLRSTGTCFTHKPVETTTLGQAVTNGICSGCGRSMVLNDDGHWAVV
ncbi:hypothetical protein [Streptomyces hebeiensis]